MVKVMYNDKKFQVIGWGVFFIKCLHKQEKTRRKGLKYKSTLCFLSRGKNTAANKWGSRDRKKIPPPEHSLI